MLRPTEMICGPRRNSKPDANRLSEGIFFLGLFCFRFSSCEKKKFFLLVFQRKRKVKKNVEDLIITGIVGIYPVNLSSGDEAYSLH